MIEQWKDIIGFEKLYQISNLAEVLVVVMALRYQEQERIMAETFQGIMVTKKAKAKTAAKTRVEAEARIKAETQVQVQKQVQAAVEMWQSGQNMTKTETWSLSICMC